MIDTHYDQGWVELRDRLLDYGIVVPESAAKSASKAVAYELILRGRVMSLKAAQRAVVAEVEAVRRAAS